MTVVELILGIAAFAAAIWVLIRVADLIAGYFMPPIKQGVSEEDVGAVLASEDDSNELAMPPHPTPQTQANYCPACGSPNHAGGQYCTHCGSYLVVPPQPRTNPQPQPLDAPTIATIPPKDTRLGEQAAVATKWLRFWIYFLLPLWAVQGFLIAGFLIWSLWNAEASTPVASLTSWLAVLLIGVAAFHVAVAFGLHARERWAWRWNWLLILLPILQIAMIPNVSGNLFSEPDFSERESVVIALYLVLWLLPNFMYWKTRRYLFTN